MSTFAGMQAGPSSGHRRIIPHHVLPAKNAEPRVPTTSSEGTRPVKSEAIDMDVWWKDETALATAWPASAIESMLGVEGSPCLEWPW